MAHVQFTDVQDRPTEFLDLTSLTLDEFQHLVPPFETAFQAHMAAWRLDGKPRTARRLACTRTAPADPGGSAAVYSRVCEDLLPSGGARALIRHGPEQSQSVDSRPPPRAPGGPAHPRRCPRPLSDAPWPSGSASRKSTRPSWSSRWRRRAPGAPIPSPRRRPPFCP